MISDAKAQAAVTYNAAADCFDAPPLEFWNRIGRKTVERLNLRPGAHVLDVCCGSGASALPAAEAVGPKGRVVGVDLAENLLCLAREKLAAKGLLNAEFRCGDLEALDATETYDAVVCVFGIFFIPDMPSAVRRLWKLVQPGGQLAITTWGKRVLEPGGTAFWNAVRTERPDLYKSFSPWDRINEPEALGAMLAEAGVVAQEITAEPGVQPLRSPDDFWTISLGSGYRGTIDQLSLDARERVRKSLLEDLVRNDVRSVETNAIYAIAHKA